MSADPTDLIYEAALQPEAWASALDALADLGESVGSVLQVARGSGAPRWVASSGVHDAFTAYMHEGDFQATYERAFRWMQRGDRFMRDIDLYLPEELESDAIRRNLSRLGLGWQLASVMKMPTDDLVCFTLERRLADDPHSIAALDRLNGLLPHLQRAGMIAARLGLENARAQVEALARIGLPAAVIRADARLLTANGDFEALDGTVVPAAFGRLALSAPRQNVRFQEALTRLRAGDHGASLPLRTGEGDLPCVMHLLPIRRSARELFTGGDVMVIVTPLAVSRMVPSAETLCGLFDLSPGEARLAAALASGRTLAEAAAGAGITIKTARTYLERVFQKTVTRQQSELVALLKSAHWLPQPSPP